MYLVAKSNPTLCDPVDCSPARLLCPWVRILESRILEWVAISSSRGSSQPRRLNPHLLCCQVDSLPPGVGREEGPAHVHGVHQRLGSSLTHTSCLCGWGQASSAQKALQQGCWRPLEPDYEPRKGADLRTGSLPSSSTSKNTCNSPWICLYPLQTSECRKNIHVHFSPHGGDVQLSASHRTEVCPSVPLLPFPARASQLWSSSHLRILPLPHLCTHKHGNMHVHPPLTI